MGEEFQSDQDFALGAADFASEREYKLHCLRHSTSHIMAAAVQQLFPEAKFGIGPPVKNGFYYDMQLSRALTPDDLEEIERRMKQIVKENREFQRDKATAAATMLVPTEDLSEEFRATITKVADGRVTFTRTLFPWSKLTVEKICTPVSFALLRASCHDRPTFPEV